MFLYIGGKTGGVGYIFGEVLYIFLSLIYVQVKRFDEKQNIAAI